MLEGKGKFYYNKKTGQASINISADIARDSNFPFKHKEEVKIKIILGYLSSPPKIYGLSIEKLEGGKPYYDRVVKLEALMKKEEEE